MNRITELFQRKDRNLLSVYFTAGYPVLEDTVEIIQMLENRGVDLVEIGIPFSDPMADGVVIQQSSTQALKNGMTLPVLLEQLTSIRSRVELPLLLMGYLNPMLRYGMENLFRKGMEIGIDGMIIPDLPFQEYLESVKPLCEKYDIPVIMLTAKSDDADRLEGLSTGADAYMSKPFNIDILRQTAENLLKNKRRLQGKYGVALQEEKMDKIELVSPNDQMMERVMKVINENISSPDLSVQFIADKIGISRVHFHRRLKDATGLTPRDFVRNIRLSQAAKLLAGKNFDITDVAIATGFRSVSTFSTCFKGYFGMTPTEYARKNAKTKAESEREEDEDVTEGLP